MVSSRSRSCSGSGCAGADDESQLKSCTMVSCSISTWGSWPSWGQCSANCGTGVCTSNSGEYTDGIGSSRKTASQCRRACEMRPDCWGYTAVDVDLFSASRSGTCYVHGHYDNSDAGSYWFEASGTAQVISSTSGSYWFEASGTAQVISST